MDENKNPLKKRLSEQLPSHSPDAGTWQNLSAKLDAIDAETAYQARLQQLPLHSPDAGTWNSIYSRLNQIGYYKTTVRIAMSVAAGILLFFAISSILDTNPVKTTTPLTAQKQQLQNQPAASEIIQKAAEPLALNNNSLKSDAVASNLTSENDKTEDQLQSVLVSEPATVEPASEIANITVQAPTGDYTQQEVAGKDQIIQSEIPVTDAGTLAEQANPVMITEPSEATAKPALKYYTPDEPVPGKKNNYFALAMNYLPENIDNGTDNSLFHNVDLTASYNKEKVRFNTSLGMAYNAQQLEFDMNYDIKTPVTATGPQGQLDTIGYNVSKMESQYQGVEKHQYLTYNLGIGRRIFSIGKFSSWINAGAGFGIRLNNPDLIASTEKSIKVQFNAEVNSVNTSKPEYNDINVNFVTGIDFNYKILERLSFTFTPTSRWYFKPVLTKDNQPTDELTLGFRTGMKFEF